MYQPEGTGPRLAQAGEQGRGCGRSGRPRAGPGRALRPGTSPRPPALGRPKPRPGRAVCGARPRHRRSGGRRRPPFGGATVHGEGCLACVRVHGYGAVCVSRGGRAGAAEDARLGSAMATATDGGGIGGARWRVTCSCSIFLSLEFLIAKCTAVSLNDYQIREVPFVVHI